MKYTAYLARQISRGAGRVKQRVEEMKASQAKAAAQVGTEAAAKGSGGGAEMGLYQFLRLLKLLRERRQQLPRVLARRGRRQKPKRLLRPLRLPREWRKQLPTVTLRRGRRGRLTPLVKLPKLLRERQRQL